MVAALWSPKLIELENKLSGVYPINTQIITHSSTESCNALNGTAHWRKTRSGAPP